MLSALVRRAALMLVQELRVAPQPAREWPPGSEPLRVRRGLFGAYLFIEDHELSDDLSAFMRDRLKPFVEAWVPTFQDEPLAPEFLVLPFGNNGANSRLDGVAMRCVIIKDMPVGDRDVPSRVTRYYDVANDEFKTAPCSMALHFAVHSPGADVMLAPEGESTECPAP